MSQQTSALGGCVCGESLTHRCPVHPRRNEAGQGGAEAQEQRVGLTGEVRPPEPDEP
ncbi:hypothetical protein REPROBATE_66 [Mycobacterium phage Reprobate]|uniref:Uncharacterized protein n=1 Tax=Mycobacterium phage Reprobate TaxID=1340828 RepID=S5Y581_9CAUD|nr:hypothetical protein REPROBATE_66 [Mycobacterium phage Reprobate]AGT12802.1 hypothetical protein REPROBATE_66 [Mycobacterium phage Reprobate]